MDILGVGGGPPLFRGAGASGWRFCSCRYNAIRYRPLGKDVSRHGGLRPNCLASMVLDELKTYGPEAIPTVIRPEEARAYCRRLARTHYENFTVTGWFMPRHLRQHFCNVYAYCRWADDLADETGDPRQGEALLDWWETLLHECYAGRATHPVFVALSETIERFAIPSTPFSDLLVAFRRDQRPTVYETRDDLLEYCRYSANPVGRIVLHMAQCHDEEKGRFCDSVCTGLQLVNFWQDVARDREIGRVYIPLADRAACGYDDAMLSARVCNEPFRRLMEMEVDDAAARLTAGLPLTRMVPRAIRLQVALFIHGGLAVADAIRRINYNVWTTRPVLTKRDKFGILLRCLLATAGVVSTPAQGSAFRLRS